MGDLVGSKESIYIYVYIYTQMEMCHTRPYVAGISKETWIELNNTVR